MTNMSAVWNCASFTDLPSKAVGILWCSTLALETVLIVLGNLLVIVLFVRNKKLRRKSLFIVINLAFADLFGGIHVPLDIYLYLGPSGNLWAPSSFKHLYIFQNLFFYGFLLTSIISAALISVERLHAIRCPLRHRKLSVREYCFVIFISWALAFILSAVFTVLLFTTTRSLAFPFLMSFFLTALLVVCGCNISIWRAFKSQHTQLQQQLNKSSQNQRLTKTVVIVSLITSLSWFPLIILIYSTTHEGPCYSSTTDFHSFWLVYALSVANSFVNPMLYALKIPGFRQVLCVSCLKRQVMVMSQHDKRGHNAEAVILSFTTNLPKLTLETVCYDSPSKYYKEVYDTKL